MFSPGDASPSTSPYSQGITNPLGIRSAPQERRKSWAGTQRGSRTPESPLPLFHSEEKKTKTRSPLSRLKPYMLNGSPTRFGRGTAAGRFLTILNFARFRGRDTKQLAILISLNIAYSTTELLLGLFLGKIGMVHWTSPLKQSLWNLTFLWRFRTSFRRVPPFLWMLRPHPLSHGNGLGKGEIRWALHLWVARKILK